MSGGYYDEMYEPEVICSSCGMTYARPDARFCRHCGLARQQVSVDVYEEEEPEEEQEQMEACPMCSFPLMSFANFCCNCGHARNSSLPMSASSMLPGLASLLPAPAEPPPPSLEEALAFHALLQSGGMPPPLPSPGLNPTPRGGRAQAVQPGLVPAAQPGLVVPHQYPPVTLPMPPPVSLPMPSFQKNQGRATKGRKQAEAPGRKQPDAPPGNFIQAEGPPGNFLPPGKFAPPGNFTVEKEKEKEKEKKPKKSEKKSQESQTKPAPPPGLDYVDDVLEEKVDMREIDINDDGGKPGYTTLMLCDIPCRKSVEDLLEIIDNLGFAGKYDLLYFPPQRGRRKEKQVQNIGYAFVNFNTHQDAVNFRHSFQKYRFPNSDSKKLGYAKPAELQGFEANYQKHLSRRESQRLFTFRDDKKEIGDNDFQ